MRDKKPLAVFTVAPSNTGGWLPTVYFFRKSKGKNIGPWGGESIQVENHTKMALRITVDDVTVEYMESQRKAKEKQERETLEALKAKYEK